jgi:hypothetical protein
MTASIADLPATGSVAAPSPVAAAGMTSGAVRTWLRLEGLAAFGAGLALFGATGSNWLLLVSLLLLPDLSAAGYLAGPRVGAFTYNLAHTWAPGLIALGLSVWLDAAPLQIAAAVLIAHVGMDRAAGYGLKLPGSFQETHLGRIGRAKG